MAPIWHRLWRKSFDSQGLTLFCNSVNLRRLPLKITVSQVLVPPSLKQNQPIAATRLWLTPEAKSGVAVNLVFAPGQTTPAFPFDIALLETTETRC
jgi:hypothetical protein